MSLPARQMGQIIIDRSFYTLIKTNQNKIFLVELIISKGEAISSSLLGQTL